MRHPASNLGYLPDRSNSKPLRRSWVIISFVQEVDYISYQGRSVVENVASAKFVRAALGSLIDKKVCTKRAAGKTRLSRYNISSSFHQSTNVDQHNGYVAIALWTYICADILSADYGGYGDSYSTTTYGVQGGAGGGGFNPNDAPQSSPSGQKVRPEKVSP